MIWLDKFANVKGGKIGSKGAIGVGEESPDTRDSVQKVVGNAHLGNPRDASRDVEGEIPRPPEFSLG